MYAEIKSVNPDSPTGKGKTSWLNADNLKITLEKDRLEHLDSPAWYVKVVANQGKEVSSGARGGEPVWIDRRLELHLTPKDIKALVDLAVDSGLIALAAVSIADEQ